MEAFDIAIRGIAEAKNLLLHPSIIAAAEIMDLYRLLDCIHDKIKTETKIEGLAHIYKTHIDDFFAKIRRFMHVPNSPNPPTHKPHHFLTQSADRSLAGISPQTSEKRRQ